MLQQKNKKIFIYVFLFFLISTINNKNLIFLNFGKINNISVKGLDEKNNFQLLEDLSFIKNKNIFFLKKKKISDVIESSSLVEKYSVYKFYPSSLGVEIDKIKFLAVVKKSDINFLLGSNGKIIKIKDTPNDLPFIFGDFKIQNFFELKRAMDEINFNYKEVKNLFFFKSGRWDIETKNGILIRLPKEEIKKTLELFLSFKAKKNFDKIKEIDLRQNNQIIINE